MAGQGRHATARCVSPPAAAARSRDKAVNGVSARLCGEPADAAGVFFPAGFAVFGLLAGVLFSAILRVFEGRRGVGGISLRRASAWGALRDSSSPCSSSRSRRPRRSSTSRCSVRSSRYAARFSRPASRRSSEGRGRGGPQERVRKRSARSAVKSGSRRTRLPPATGPDRRPRGRRGAASGGHAWAGSTRTVITSVSWYWLWRTEEA